MWAIYYILGKNLEPPLLALDTTNEAGWLAGMAGWLDCTRGGGGTQ